MRWISVLELLAVGEVSDGLFRYLCINRARRGVKDRGVYLGGDNEAVVGAIKDVLAGGAGEIAVVLLGRITLQEVWLEDLGRLCDASCECTQINFVHLC
jgi:hypothetical protein